MYFGYGIVGFIIGGMVAGGGRYFALGSIFGAVVGLLLARITKLDRRVRQLESQAQVPQHSAPDVSVSPTLPFTPDSEIAHSGNLGSPYENSPRPAPEAVLEPPARIHPSDHQREARAPAGKAHPPILQVLVKSASRWLSTGNIPVKVGVIISFIGVAFLLKYAIDRKLFYMSLELRLLAVAAAGVALQCIGWRLRSKARVYALSLQGGGSGILFLTIFAALRVWQMIPASLAFALLLVLTALTGALAVLQNSRSLAILGIVGGFLAPVLTSTGQGSHVVLFSYYLVLNGAILGIAWFRAWRELNLVGFFFTFLIGSWWGYQYYKPELMASTMPFLVLHFLFYQAIAILYALRQAPGRIGLVDGTLVFGTPVIAFALQAALVSDTEYGLAISAAVVAVTYALTAVWLSRRQSADLHLLTESFMALAVAFATMTIPLALDARWTAACWALEGAALVWVAVRQDRLLARLAGVTLVFLSGLAFLDHGWRHQAGLPFLNGNMLGGLLISVSAFFTSRKLDSAPQLSFRVAHRVAGIALFLWGLTWWIGSGWEEIYDRVTVDNRLPAFLLYLTVSTGLATWLCQARQWSRLRRTLLIFLPLMALLIPDYQWDRQHFLIGLGWLAWPAAWIIQVFVLRALDRSADPLAAAAHILSLFLLTFMLALETSWWVGRAAPGDWPAAMVSVVPGLMALLVWRFSKRPGWPIPAHPMSYLAASILLVAGQIVFLISESVLRPGTPLSRFYIPLFNPLDLAMLFAMVTALVSLTVIRRNRDEMRVAQLEPYARPYKLALLAAFFFLTTAALVRGVHHYAAVPWTWDALFNSVVVQTSLSIYWGMLGFNSMIWGARRRLRLLWLAGAGFMALVVLKLFLIDLGNSGTVARIISFIGIGALLLVVGYFAPAPPREPDKPNSREAV